MRIMPLSSGDSVVFSKQGISTSPVAPVAATPLIQTR